MIFQNIIKEFAPESYYHIYNRGVAKQKIFLDDQDYKVFLGYLKLYLTKPVTDDKIAPSKHLKNYFEQVKLLAYCLLPNHFHLFVFQKESNTITDLMRSIGTKYSMYFNKKYKRVGPLFQSRYKAVRVIRESQFIYLSKYIHRNPLPARTDPAGYKYSSYQNYLGRFSQTWVDKSEILSYFSKLNPAESYQEFVEEIDERDLLMIKDLMIDFAA